MGFDDRNHISSWVAHEIRVRARDAGYLVKLTGVEALFAKREGALQAISRNDISSCWWLRSYPDMVLRSPTIIANMEVKALTDSTENAAVELVQLCTLATVNRAMGYPFYYCFGRPAVDDSLQAYVISVDELRPIKIKLTLRSEHFGLRVRQVATRLWPHVPIDEGESTKGSNTPFALISKWNIFNLACPLTDWLQMNAGTPPFGMRERIAWEGTKDAHHTWAHIPFNRWKQ